MSKSSKLKILNKPNDDEPWYKDGLRFQCTECGKCCTGSPGYVWLDANEIQDIADFLKIPVKEVMLKYIRQKDQRYSLIEKRSENFDCVFLKEGRCQIYQARPKQCRTFPWWVQNLKSKDCWNEAAKECEGINDQAPLFTIEEINEGQKG